MYPEKLKVIAQQVQLQQQQEQVRLLHQEKLEREQQIRTQVSAWTPPQPTLAVTHPWGHPSGLPPLSGTVGRPGVKYGVSGRFSDVLGTSRPSGLAGMDSGIPAKLLPLGNWESVGAQPAPPPPQLGGLR